MDAGGTIDEVHGGEEPKPQRAALSASMVAIMESQVEEMRRILMRFKVCTNPVAAPGAASASSETPQSNQLPPHADILVFGPTGSGKSSLIRTFYMALHKAKAVPDDFGDRIIVKDTALNEGTLKYVSAVIKPAKLDHRGGQVSSGIICHDTRGHIFMDEKEQKQLGIIMDGAVRDDTVVQQRNSRYARLLWEFWRRDADLFPQEILVRKNGLSTRPHALLFVLDGSMDEIPNGEEDTQFYREIIQIAKSKGYLHLQVVLTRIDRVEEQLAQKGGVADAAKMELRLRQVLDRKIEDVVTKLEVPRNSVHFVENYHSGGRRNVSIDFHALKILTQCCSHADAFVMQKLKEQKPAQCAIQ